MDKEQLSKEMGLIVEKFASQAQARLMHAIAGGAESEGGGPSKKVADEFVDQSHGQDVKSFPEKAPKVQADDVGTGGVAMGMAEDGEDGGEREAKQHLAGFYKNLRARMSYRDDDDFAQYFTQYVNQEAFSGKEDIDKYYGGEFTVEDLKELFELTNAPIESSQLTANDLANQIGISAEQAGGDQYDGQHVYSVFNDGEVSSEKGGYLLNRRNLHMVLGGITKSPQHTFPIQDGKHSKIYAANRSDAMKIRAAIVKDLGFDEDPDPYAKHEMSESQIKGCTSMRPISESKINEIADVMSEDINDY